VNYPYPAYVICLDNKPLIEENGEIVLYHAGRDEILWPRFEALVYLCKDSSRLTIQKFQLNPVCHEDAIDKDDFIKQAQKTRRQG
jgi:hypothetical protein